MKGTVLNLQVRLGLMIWPLAPSFQTCPVGRITKTVFSVPRTTHTNRGVLSFHVGNYEDRSRGRTRSIQSRRQHFEYSRVAGRKGGLTPVGSPQPAARLSTLPSSATRDR